MSPKPKETAKKPIANVIRPAISSSSLVYVPEDVVEGFQGRIETGINWTLIEAAARHHKKLSLREEIPKLSFSKAYQNKLNKTILSGFLDEESTLTLDQQFDVILPLILWDNEKCANEEGKICFKNANCITDNLVPLIRKTIKAGDRKVLKNDLKLVTVLRVNDSEMTELDKGLTEFHKLVTLNLCGNYITDIDASCIPPGVRSLELQANFIRSMNSFGQHLPVDLLYLGLSRNLLTDNTDGFGHLPHQLMVLDLSDNDIYQLEPLLNELAQLPTLTSLFLAGNPCSMCAGYARTTIHRLSHLKWLDNREILRTDRTEEHYEPHPDDLRSAYLYFTIFRIMSTPPPPKAEKGAITTFHIELQLPLLDVTRRRHLFYRRNESLTEMLPAPEDDDWGVSKFTSLDLSNKFCTEQEASEHELDVYAQLERKNSRQICQFTTYESNRVPWSKIMNFQEPVLKIFCPDLVALRDTFRTVVTAKLVYTMTIAPSKGKPDKKQSQVFKGPTGEHRVTLATIKCALRRPDWSQASQHFHWDDSLGSDEAIHWGDGDLSILQYVTVAVKPTKGKIDADTGSKQVIPDNLTCHFGFGIETIHP